MHGPVHEYLARDHDRLDAFLAAALRENGTVDAEAYDGFRRGLLRHIGIEEKILFPLIRKSGADLRVIEQLHRDHALLAALLVPPPAAAEIEEIRALLEEHNPREECPGGIYDVFEALAKEDAEALLKRVVETPPVRVNPNVDGLVIRDSIARLRAARTV
jgi:hemerythrin-like domain-containing protein